MASEHPARGYDEITLLALEQALKDVWQVLRAHDFHRDWDRDPELKRDGGRTPAGFKTIECSIMDVADDIAYSTYDLEDAFKAGFLSPLSILSKDDQFKTKVIKEVNRKVVAQFGGGEGQLEIKDFDNIIASLFADLFAVSGDLRARYPSSSTLSDEVLSEFAVISAGQASSRSAALSENGYLRGEFTS